MRGEVQIAIRRKAAERKNRSEGEKRSVFVTRKRSVTLERCSAPQSATKGAFAEGFEDAPRSDRQKVCLFVPLPDSDCEDSMALTEDDSGCHGLRQIKRQVTGAGTDELIQPLKRNGCQPYRTVDSNGGGS